MPTKINKKEPKKMMNFLFKNKEKKEAEEKYKKQVAELRAIKSKTDHPKMINRLRQGHIIYLASMKSIARERKKKKVPVKHVGCTSDLQEIQYGRYETYNISGKPDKLYENLQKVFSRPIESNRRTVIDPTGFCRYSCEIKPRQPIKPRKFWDNLWPQIIKS